MILSNTVYLYSHYQKLAQARLGKAQRVGDMQMIELSVKRLPYVSGHYILYLRSLMALYVVFNRGFLRV